MTTRQTTKIDKDGLTMMSEIVIDVKPFAIAASCTYISSTFTLIRCDVISTNK